MKKSILEQYKDLSTISNEEYIISSSRTRNRDKTQVILWEKIHWSLEDNDYPLARCPKQRCNVKLKKSKEQYNIGEYKYYCPHCDFKITLNESIEDKSEDLINVIEAKKYNDAEIINIDGELIKVQREQQIDSDYWADVKISKNKKGEFQLMVLAGSKKLKDKAQLFLDPQNEKLSFDQYNNHPKEVFAKVVATFKDSQSEISSKK